MPRKSNADRRAPTSHARQRLSAHLDFVRQAHEAAADVAAQWRRLGYIKDAETAARAKLEAVRAQDVKELAEQLVNPTGMHDVAAHDAFGEAEWELARAAREADIARACEAAVVERNTAAVHAVAAAERETGPILIDVMVEDAALLAKQINADAARLRAKYARLWGLRRHLADAGAHRRVQDVALPTHPDNICPPPAEIVAAIEVWRAYGGRLGTDPAAKIEEGPANGR